MTSPVLVYLAGMPGAGKSTLMAEIIGDAVRTPVASRVPHDALEVDGRVVGCELGRRQRDDAAGTDALNDRVQARAESWIAAVPYPLVLAEGERLANRSFLAAAETAGYRIRLIYLDIARDVADARRELAPAAPDDVRWLAGSSARAASIATAAQSTGWLAGILDGHKPPMALAHAARRLVPELERFA